MDIRLKRLFLSQLYELSFYGKKCATDCSLIREPLGGPLSLGIRFSESLSMTTDLGLFGAIFDRMSVNIRLTHANSCNSLIYKYNLKVKIRLTRVSH
jgi:hypothetical protein